VRAAGQVPEGGGGLCQRCGIHHAESRSTASICDARTESGHGQAVLTPEVVDPVAIHSHALQIGRSQPGKDEDHGAGLVGSVYGILDDAEIRHVQGIGRDPENGIAIAGIADAITILVLL